MPMHTSMHKSTHLSVHMSLRRYIEMSNMHPDMQAHYSRNQLN